VTDVIVDMVISRAVQDCFYGLMVVINRSNV
jgi:hypothetical protein